MFPWLRMTLLLAASGHQGHKESLHPSGWIYWLGQGHARWRQLMGEEHNWWNDTHPLQHHNCNSRKRHLSCTLKVCEHECCSCMVSKNQNQELCSKENLSSWIWWFSMIPYAEQGKLNWKICSKESITIMMRNAWQASRPPSTLVRNGGKSGERVKRTKWRHKAFPGWSGTTHTCPANPQNDIE